MFLSPDDRSVDYLVNVEGLDQVLASRLVYARLPPTSGPVPPDPRTATPEQHRVWVRAWVRHVALTVFGAEALRLPRGWSG